MPRQYLRRRLPDRDTFTRHPFLRRCAPWLGHHNLWHLNRRSVSGGFAVGLFCGLIPGPLQAVAATLAALAWRVNLPVAVCTTFYTNPLTIVPLYLVAFGIGRFLVGADGPANLPPTPDFDWSALGDTARGWFEWVTALGLPLAIGLPVLATVLAVLGYAAMYYGWRLHVIHALRRRTRLRSSRSA